MMRRPQIALLPDGRRLHLQDGPIDLVIEACGDRAEVEIAYAAAAESFTGLLDRLCDELPELRRQNAARIPSLKGVVARRMHAAVLPYADTHFITPMAAVAGAVAEEVLGKTVIDADGVVRGIATSGRHGRSFSLGIADAVTVLARTASQADAAATMIANAVDLPGHPGIVRVPACEIQPDNDLGERLVTRDVAPLTCNEVTRALEAGAVHARELLARGLIEGAALCLQGETQIVAPTHSCAFDLSYSRATIAPTGNLIDA